MKTTKCECGFIMIDRDEAICQNCKKMNLKCEDCGCSIYATTRRKKYCDTCADGRSQMVNRERDQSKKHRCGCGEMHRKSNFTTHEGREICGTCYDKITEAMNRRTEENERRDPYMGMSAISNGIAQARYSF
jgi:hypothetical protein